MKAWLIHEGAGAVVNTLEQFGVVKGSDGAKWAGVINVANLKPE